MASLLQSVGLNVVDLLDFMLKSLEHEALTSLPTSDAMCMIDELGSKDELMNIKKDNIFSLLFARIERARAEGCVNDEAIRERLMKDADLLNVISEHHCAIVLQEFRRYLRSRRLKEEDLGTDQMGKIIKQIFDASLSALSD